MTEELQELEPLADEPATAPPPADDVALAEAAPQVRAALPILGAPAYNPAAGKEYYRFLLAGVVILIGCFMPFGPQLELAGYKTLSGAFTLVIALGMVWTWWGSIAINRFTGRSLIWVLFCLLPLLNQLFNLLTAFDAPAVRAAIDDPSTPMPANWGEFFEALGAFTDPEKKLVADNFLRAFGTGKIVVFLGAVLAEVFLLTAIVGGVKTANQQKAARMAAKSGAAGKRRR